MSSAIPETAALQRPCSFGFPFHLPSFTRPGGKEAKKTDRNKSEKREIPRIPERPAQIWEGALWGSYWGSIHLTEHTFSTPYQTGLRALQRKHLQTDLGL